VVDVIIPNIGDVNVIKTTIPEPGDYTLEFLMPTEINSRNDQEDINCSFTIKIGETKDKAREFKVSRINYFSTIGSERTSIYYIDQRFALTPGSVFIEIMLNSPCEILRRRDAKVSFLEAPRGMTEKVIVKQLEFILGVILFCIGIFGSISFEVKRKRDVRNLA
jgi:hypothetical protein